MADPTTVDLLELGDHICWTFDDDERRLAAMARYVAAGLTAGQKVLYLTQALLPEALLAGLESAGVAASVAVDRGQLKIASADSTFLTGGSFAPETALSMWAKAVDGATGDGYAGLRIASDMAWALRPAAGLHRLAWYEAQANRVFCEGKAMAVCCYDRRLFTIDELSRIGAAHPGSAWALAGSDGRWGPLLRMRLGDLPHHLVLAGQADQSNRHALATMLLHLLDNAADGDVAACVDLSRLSFADVAVARLLVQTGRASPGELHLTGCPAPLHRLLQQIDPHNSAGLVVDLRAGDGWEAA